MIIDNTIQLWNEYQNLHDEIKGADALNYQIIGIIVGAASIILTTGFGQENPMFRTLIFWCVYVVTIPGYRLLQGNRRRIWRLSTYIRIFLEPQLDVKWETRISLQRQLVSHEKGQDFSSLIGTNEWFIIAIDKHHSWNYINICRTIANSNNPIISIFKNHCSFDF